MAAVAVPNSGGRGALANVMRGRVEKAPRVLVYSREKIGKTSFASGAPTPIFLASELGTEEFDVARAPVTAWQQGLDLVEALIADPHEYRTLVIDTLDHLEAVLHRHIIANDAKGATSMVTAAGGFGKAFKIATEAFRKLAARLDVLTEKRRMNIVLLAHAHVKKFNDPESDGWDQYRLKMHEEAAGFWKEWVDAVLFANLDIAVRVDDNDKTRAIGTGDRYLYTVPPRNAAYEAGNRWALPARLPLRWSAFEESLRASSALRGELTTLLPKLPEDTARVASERAREAKDFESLKVIVERARELASNSNATNNSSSQKEQSK